MSSHISLKPKGIKQSNNSNTQRPNQSSQRNTTTQPSSMMSNNNIEPSIYQPLKINRIKYQSSLGNKQQMYMASFSLNYEQNNKINKSRSNDQIVNSRSTASEDILEHFNMLSNTTRVNGGYNNKQSLFGSINNSNSNLINQQPTTISGLKLYTPSVINNNNNSSINENKNENLHHTVYEQYIYTLQSQISARQLQRLRLTKQIQDIKQYNRSLLQMIKSQRQNYMKKNTESNGTLKQLKQFNIKLMNQKRLLQENIFNLNNNSMNNNSKKANQWTKVQFQQISNQKQQLNKKYSQCLIRYNQVRTQNCKLHLQLQTQQKKSTNFNKSTIILINKFKPTKQNSANIILRFNKKSMKSVKNKKLFSNCLVHYQENKRKIKKLRTN